MQGIRRSFHYILLFLDIIILVFSFSIADLVSRNRLPDVFQEKLDVISLPEIFTILIFFLIWFFSSKVSSLYDELKSYNFLSEAFTLLKNISIQLITGVIILFSLKNVLLSRFFLLLYLSLLLSGTLILRGVFRLVRKILVNKVGIKKKVLMIGSSNIGREIFGTPDNSLIMGHDLVGFVAEAPAGSDLNYLGGFQDLGKVIDEYEIDEVLIALNGEEAEKLDSIMKVLTGFPVRARIVPEYFKFVSNKYQISFFNNIPVIDVRNDPLDELHWRLIKRGFDFIFSSLFLLLIFSWLGFLIAVVIKVSSRGPVFFKQERWGRKNRKFTLYKFRSMVKESRDLNSEGRFVQATKDDSRVTQFGKFLRKTSLDELPQFFNVFKGNMSVIGPRPHAVPMNIESKDKIENYMLRHLVKPGITGWAQVNGLRGATDDKKLLEKRIEYDMFYIENWSFWFDLRIIFLTIWIGVRGDPNAY
ncbi:MAG: undecaprenyl-phosphate glucose phosphotransferase [Candidatus Aminicenantes bacterium]|nr:undecaprenyl-phosphate glucose phosphotransferase [Candidatus Aminicenantes bacterium]